MRKLFSTIGRYALLFMRGYGEMIIFMIETLKAFRKIPFYLPQIVEQYRYIEQKSRSLIIATGAFMGLVLGVQIGTQIVSGTPTWVEGGLILRAVLLEMGPIILSLILAGRVGSGIAAELGAMQVTEQIDALRVMAVNPIEFLVMPRVVAGLIAVPVLIIYGDLVSIMSGFFSSYFTIHLRWSGFVKGMRRSFLPTDVYTSIIKGVVFGAIIISFGAYFGMHSRRGAKGVGTATTQAFVWSALAVIVLDYVISSALFFIW
ncbi:MAG TPA: ABC transporter permease [Spirochaetia bacterium]|nr:ABC transporter permease [Spirochaetia bacterium]